MANASIQYDVTTREVVVKEEVKTPKIVLELTVREALVIRMLIGRTTGISDISFPIHDALANAGVPSTAHVFYENLPTINTNGLLVDRAFVKLVTELEAKLKA